MDLVGFIIRIYSYGKVCYRQQRNALRSSFKFSFSLNLKKIGFSQNIFIEFPSILFHGNTPSGSRIDTCSHKDRQKIITKLKLRSSANTLERTKISSTPRRKLEITSREASTRFSRLQQNHRKVARLKDTREYSKISHKLLVCQLFPVALLLTYLIAIILRPRK